MNNPILQLQQQRLLLEIEYNHEKEEFRKQMLRLGGEITTVETFFEGQTKDFKVELAKIKKSQPDAIFIAGYPVETALIACQARDMGMNLPLITTDGSASEKRFLLRQT